MVTNETVPEEGVFGIVEKIANGHEGPYAVVRLKTKEVITFSLHKDVWDEKDYPILGEQVQLFKLRKKRFGWRALLVTRITL